MSMRVHVFKCVYASLCVNVCESSNNSTLCLSARVHMHAYIMCACLRVCIYACLMFACVCWCAYACLCVPTNINIREQPLYFV